MEVIINDLSLNAQFEDIDDFLDSLNECTIPILDILEKLNIQILSSYNSFGLMVTKDKTLYDILAIKGSPEIRKFKRQLQELFFDEPYWDSNPKSINNIYECSFTSENNKYCLAEALERSCSVISFENDQFKEITIIIRKDGKCHLVNNFYNKDGLLDVFRENGQISQLDYLLQKYSLSESFGMRVGKNYFDEFIQEASLVGEDVEKIINDIERFILLLKENKDLGRLSKPIEGKLKEFRTSISDSREIRIFYIEKSAKVIFLNGFLKKTQKTPEREIEKAKNIMSKLI